MTMHKWPSINQFRSVVKLVCENAEYKGVTPPKVVYEGTVKTHGTNAAVYVDMDTDELRCQSRSRLITPDNDNQGFAFFVHKNEEIFRQLCELATVAQGTQAIIYGEWCGRGINKGCAIHEEEEKFFLIFGVKQMIDEENRYYEDNIEFMHLSSVKHRIFNVSMFPTYTVEIDFNEPHLVQPTLIAFTEEVEKECPVGKFFGHTGIGEGIVWKPTKVPMGSDYWFKVKGEKHSVSKVKTLVEVDLEKVASVLEFAHIVVTEVRVDQGIEHLKEMGKTLDRSSTGDFLRWFMNDVIKEELDRMAVARLEPKDIGKDVSSKARVLFFEKIDAMC